MKIKSFIEKDDTLNSKRLITSKLLEFFDKINTNIISILHYGRIKTFVCLFSGYKLISLSRDGKYVFWAYISRDTSPIIEQSKWLDHTDNYRKNGEL